MLDLADYCGRLARADKLALRDWTNDRIGPPLLREALAWFECEVVSELPAGDHVLVVGRVIDGKLVDSEAEPMCYRETGARCFYSYPRRFRRLMTHSALQYTILLTGVIGSAVAPAWMRRTLDSRD
jgi:flavin reductase (DIM6/NTAB) family NADH-FMN oxidoreductase RutF